MILQAEALAGQQVASYPPATVISIHVKMAPQHHEMCHKHFFSFSSHSD